MSIHEAITLLIDGGIVIFPTDTAWGIGCRADDEQAVARLFRIRRRPAQQAMPVLVDSMTMAEKYYTTPLPDIVRHLMKRYWPGALTIVYICRESAVSPLLRGNRNTIGLRMPDHEVPLTLIRSTGVPILGPSANFHGHPTPFSAKDLDPELVKLTDGIIDGACSPACLASTVIDCTKVPPNILRQGAVTVSLSSPQSQSSSQFSSQS